MTEGSRLAVEDVASYPHEMRFELLDGRFVRRPHSTMVHQDHILPYARAGIPAYWLVDSLADEIAVTEFAWGLKVNASSTGILPSTS
ncbi:hypothetical protein [Paractinoplanes hotanensis]|uniref:Restriction endonuclease domain-containing protein n=1 Tax=Paractinoplanes hotanensis TaxID=2906497 RepID=A0ABT0YCR8_9ACTN|nr:hypothetical protein [Actinoplanes hotanensis]MCM4083283.1 hypothetical protein [Actinoplanes hotanensis]